MTNFDVNLFSYSSLKKAKSAVIYMNIKTYTKQQQIFFYIKRKTKFIYTT